MFDTTAAMRVCGVRLPLIEALPAAVLVGPGSEPGSPHLSFRIGACEAQALLRELRGQETIRSRAVHGMARVAAALGGSLTAVRLLRSGPGLARAVVHIETVDGVIDVPADPGLALATAILLDLPLLVERALVESLRAATHAELPAPW